jgi:hypothetical protein
MVDLDLVSAKRVELAPRRPSRPGAYPSRCCSSRVPSAPTGARAVAELDHLDLNIAYPVGPKVAKYGCNLANTSWCRGGAATGRADLRAKDARASVRRAAKRLHVKVFARDPGNPARAVDWEEIKVEPRP